MTKKSQKTKVAATSENVLGLILDMVEHSAPLAEGNFARVYKFKDKDLADYVLRVAALPEGMTIKDALTSKTALSPPKNFLLEAHMGQALLTNNPRSNTPFLSIHQRIEGVSLKQLKEQYPDSQSRLQVFYDTIKKANANPFYDLFIDASRVAFSKKMLDPNLGNIMINLENGSLHVIDQLSIEKAGYGDVDQAIEYIKKIKSKVETALTDFTQQDTNRPVFKQQLDDIRNMMQQACKAAEQQVRKEPKPLKFAAISSTKAIKMDSPRAELIKTLQELNKQIQDSTRHR